MANGIMRPRITMAIVLFVLAAVLAPGAFSQEKKRAPEKQPDAKPAAQATPATPPASSTPAPPPTIDSALSGLKLREIGPAIMGGRIDDIAVVENNPDTFFVGAASGGVWKTT